MNAGSLAKSDTAVLQPDAKIQPRDIAHSATESGAVTNKRPFSVRSQPEIAGVGTLAHDLRVSPPGYRKASIAVTAGVSADSDPHITTGSGELALAKLPSTVTTEGVSVPANEAVERVIEVTLAEYATLAAEIRGRSEAQASLMNIAAVASVGLAGYSLQAGGAGRQLVLLLPFVGAIFGLLWLDHHRAITKLGSFIREHSRSEILEALNLIEEIPDEVGQKLLRWEWTSQQLTSASRRQIVTNFVTPQAVVFMLPGLVGLGFGSYVAIESASDGVGPWPLLWQFGLLGLGLLLLFHLLVQWRKAFKPVRFLGLETINDEETAFLERHRSKSVVKDSGPAVSSRTDHGENDSRDRGR